MFIIGTRDVSSEHQGTAGALLTTSQYLSAAITVAILTLVLGAASSDNSFRAAFFITTAAAAVVGLLVTAQRDWLTVLTTRPWCDPDATLSAALMP